MTLAFEAKYVSCTSAIEGEILQVIFDTKAESEEEEGRDSPYVLVSRNFEFADAATIEWHDGRDYDGGAEIVSATLSRSRLLIKLDRDLDPDVTFQLPDRKYARLSDFLQRSVEERLSLVE